MILGLDFRPGLLGCAGIGRTVQELTRALAPLLGERDELVLFGAAFRQPGDETRPDRAWIEAHPRIRLVQRRFPNRLLTGLGALGWMGVESLTGPLDLFLHTDFVYSPLLRTPAGMILYDLTFMQSERGYHSPSFCRTIARRVAQALARARGVIVPTRAVEEDLHRHFPGLDIPVKVIPLGGDHLGRIPAVLPATMEIPAPYFLSVGTFEPRKNRRRILRAFEAVSADHPRLRMVMVGTAGWLDEPFRAELVRSPIQRRIVLLDRVDDAALRHLYEHALALVYPSLEEGFGLPVAEAMALGCPVITSDRSSLPEVAGGAAILVDPHDEAALARAMDRIARERSLAEDLKTAGKKRAVALTWKRSAADTLNFLRTLARG